MKYSHAYALLGVGFVLLASAVYLNLWGIAAHVLPFIERTTRVEVSPASAFTVPEGFTVSIFAKDVPGARVLIRDPRGTMLVSQTSEGKVSALSETGEATTVIEGLHGPHGLAFVGNDLYIAEENAVKKYTYDPVTHKASNPTVIASLPSGNGHSTRSLQLSPDGKTLWVATGSSCNVCHEESPLRAAISAVDLTTKEIRQFAKGLRNSVFMTLNPIDGALWATDMGRDLLGDDIPPDEVNIIVDGANYGWPNCYGNNIHDTEFDHNTYIRNPCMEPFETPPKIQIQAHSAPLGLMFVPEEGWPENMRHDLLVAYHGSWNRSEPTGYKVVRYDITSGYTGEPVDIMSGFIKSDGTVIGRPVAVLAEPGGTVYISDDKAGAIYKISLTHEAE